MTARERLAVLLPKRQPDRKVISIRSRMAEPIGKELARRIFHRAMRRVLAMPGVHLWSRPLRVIIPGPIEWLVVRYRAYEYRAATQSEVAPVTVRELDSILASDRMMSLDLSDEEASVFRQFVTSGLSAKTAMAVV